LITAQNAQEDAPLGIIIKLQTGEDRYQQLAASRLKTARLSAGWDQKRLAAALSDVLGVVVVERQLGAWEEGTESFISGIMPAAYDVMGISEAEVLGLDNPDVEQVNRLAVAVARVRALLNDPTALMRRATELMEGKAKPLLAWMGSALVDWERVAQRMTCCALAYWNWDDPFGFSIWVGNMTGNDLLRHILP